MTLQLEGVACLVVGAGAVAVRRARSLAASRAHVTLVAGTDPRDDLAGVDVQRREFRADDCARARYVFAATGDRDDDARVAAAAREAGSVVHVEDAPALCDFALPAIHRSGPVSVAVSTSGASPALASWLRDRLAEAVPRDLGDVALVLGRCRAALRAAGRTTEGLPWRALLDDLADTPPRGPDDLEEQVRRWAVSLP